MVLHKAGSGLRMRGGAPYPHSTLIDASLFCVRVCVQFLCDGDAA